MRQVRFSNSLCCYVGTSIQQGMPRPLWDTPQKRIYIRKTFKSAFRLIIAKMLADTPLSMHPLPNVQKKFEKNKFFNN